MTEPRKHLELTWKTTPKSNCTSNRNCPVKMQWVVPKKIQTPLKDEIKDNPPPPADILYHDLANFLFGRVMPFFGTSQWYHYTIHCLS